MSSVSPDDEAQQNFWIAAFVVAGASWPTEAGLRTAATAYEAR